MKNGDERKATATLDVSTFDGVRMGGIRRKGDKETIYYTPGELSTLVLNGDIDAEMSLNLINMIDLTKG